MATQADAQAEPVPLLPEVLKISSLNDAQATTQSPIPECEHESGTSGSESEVYQDRVTIGPVLDEEDADESDMSVEKLTSGSDLTAQVEAESGRMLDDWYEPEDIEVLMANGSMVVDKEEEMDDDDAGIIDSDNEANWGNGSDSDSEQCTL